MSNLYGWAERNRKIANRFTPGFEALQRDLARRLAVKDTLDRVITAQAQHILALERIYASLPKIDLTAITALIERWMPPNWPPEVDDRAIQKIVNDDGIPVVWVPPREVLAQVLTAGDRETRVAILLANQSALVEGCREVLGEVEHPVYAGQVPLATAALDAFANGHLEAAQALAVAVTDTIVIHRHGRGYGRIARDVVVADIDDLRMAEFRVRLAMAPVARFFTDYWPNRGKEPPTALSRHVTVHFAHIDHYSRENALIAVLLMTSILRTFQDHREVEEELSGSAETVG
ncbi:hypothetical protein [Oryzihumus leptocrescens]|uniref:hypothetical protein n=1 Tax=Oryzihumus leptocrescens TaxID=297536 RepID=UPI001151A0C3|nr:hypothetical protein [Oryzihumus leptocrescens]